MLFAVYCLPFKECRCLTKVSKKAVIIGSALGAVVTLGAAISMDYVLSSSLQGTWRDAAVKDVTKMFGPSCGQNWFAVTLVLVVVMDSLPDSAPCSAPSPGPS